MKNQDGKEKKLMDELETLYRRVAELEKSEALREPVEALRSYYETLRVAPDASLETIRESYERLVDFWDPRRYGDDPSLKENAERKLAGITHAYEKILASRQREKEAGTAEPPRLAGKVPGHSAPDEETGGHFPRGKILLGGFALLVVVLVVYFWPDLYHYHTIEMENLNDQVRKNRLPDRVSSLQEGRWTKDPAPEAKSSAPSPPFAPGVPAKPPAVPEEQLISPGASKPGSPEESKIPEKKEAPGKKQPVPKTKSIGFTIQVGALRDVNTAKKFVEEQKRNGIQVYWAEIKTQDQGVWYRVYLGRFANSADAARYMEEKKIRELFPKSFIRKLS